MCVAGLFLWPSLLNWISSFETLWEEIMQNLVFISRKPAGETSQHSHNISCIFVCHIKRRTKAN